MKAALLIIVIFALLLLAGVITVARASEPATLYYTTSGQQPQMGYLDAMLLNPHCDEDDRRFQRYSPLESEAGTCWRYRIWRCATSNEEGVDVEHLALKHCEDKP